MSIFKCKMCGGTIEFTEGATVGVCDSCGTKQTLPRLDDDRRANLYDRANHFRRNNEFDKAAGIYEQILTEDTTDAEAYWSLVLCRYGIEYVEDPATRKRVPTVNRAQFTSIFDDDNYKSALRYADGYQRELYENEAKTINDIQKGILAISQKEDPFDVFICYKETDPNGRRTPDSVLATDLYHGLTQEGFKVFFSRITLEDKLGTAYEPYIFAALNSSKVMVVLGTKPEHFNAVWVKNEWSRYLALVKASGGKKTLIPAYRDMDPYDLPEEFSHLQAQDMSKLGFMQDLIRGIKKIVGESEPRTAVKETVVVGTGNANVAPLLKRAFLFLEDGEWDEADAYCEKVLDQDPENAEAYLGKLMAELHVRRQEELENCKEPFDGSNNYQKAVRFGGGKMSSVLNGYIAHINERNENERLTRIYNSAVSAMKAANTESAYKAAAGTFKSISGFQDADALALQCLDKAEVCRKDAIYASAHTEQIKNSKAGCESAIQLYKSISGWKDADEQITACQRKIEEIKAKEEADRLEAARKAEERRIAAEKAAKKRKKIAAIVTPIVVACIAFIIVLTTVIIPNGKYNSAVELYNAGKYDEAITAFKALNGYKDSATQITKCETGIKDAKYNSAVELYNAGKYEDAYKAFNSLKYKDSADKAAECLFLKQKAGLANVKAGSTIKFGFYEQDNNTSNGKEEIEWKVLAVEGNKALIISQYALDCQKYNSTYTDTTWEKCTLRTWLNGTFYNAAFGAYHQKMIASSTVTADKNPSYSTSPGNNTTDKVFLLSITEVNKFFSSDSARQCSATAYAKAQGAYTSTRDGNCWCWLRSPGTDSNRAAGVSGVGSVRNDGSIVHYAFGAVRPAMWIEIFDQEKQKEEILEAERKYITATKLFDERKYNEAIFIFKELDSYKDSVTQIVKCRMAILRNANVGEYVCFGSYDQDNDTSNGKEDIEWLVLAKEDNKSLLISRYALDCQPYNTIKMQTTWEASFLRKWLNETFWNEAFSVDEGKPICNSSLTSDDALPTDELTGNNDKVFLLSIAEVNRYFDSSEAKQCKPTAAAKARRAYVNADTGNCYWWLRSPASISIDPTSDPGQAATVDDRGVVTHHPYMMGDGFDAVRPAMWIDLS